MHCIMDTSGLYTVADISLADAGEKRVAWARSRMPALAALRKTPKSKKLLQGKECLDANM